MANLGIGLGAFTQGLTQGLGIRRQMDQDAEDKKDREDQRARQAKLDAEHEQDRAYDLRQRDRAEKNQDAVDAINEDARTEFQKEVADGTVKAGDFDAFYDQYYMPKMRNELLLQGDMQGAKALQDWSDSEGARKGRKLFSQAIMKAQAGDPGGALDDAIAAGKVQGYLDHDYEISDKEEIKDASGNLVGYRVTLKSDGKEVHQDIALDDVPTVVATFANPDEAWRSQQAAAASKKKRAEDLQDYGTKKAIDAQYDAPKRRQDAIKSLQDDEKNAAAGLGDDPNYKPFSKMSPEEQEQAISARVALMNGSNAGSSAVPTPKVIVDNSTGQAVGLTGNGTGPSSSTPAPLGQAPAAPAASPAAAVGIAPAKAPAAASAPAPSPTDVSTAVVPPSPTVDPMAPGQTTMTPSRGMQGNSAGFGSNPVSTGQGQLVYGRTPAQVVASAKDALSRGADAGQVVQALQQAGIPRNYWPEQLGSAP
jgi:hypothetical protein